MLQHYLPPEQAPRHNSRAQFYRELPTLLAPAFTGVERTQLHELTASALRYFQFALYLDDLLDGDIQLSPSTRSGLLGAVTLHEESIKGLATLFPKGHPFWQHFTQCRQTFDQAQHGPATAPTDWTQERFEAQAVAKSAMSEVVGYALHSLSTQSTKSDQTLAAVLQCLQWYHIASQYEDDIIDFCQDWEQGQPTYTHAQVLAYLQVAGIEQEAPPTTTRLQQYLYTSGIAGQLLSRAEHYYRRVTTQAQLLGLTTLATLAVQQTTGTVELQSQIREQVSAATARARAVLEGQGTQQVPLASVA